MALSSSVYGSVGTPRVYVDYIQYAKAIGHIKEHTINHLTGDANSAWDFNPIKFSTYQTDSGVGENIHFRTRFANYPYTEFGINRQFANLLSTINYYGVLGHNLGIDANHEISRTAMVLSGGSDVLSVMDSATELAGIVGDPHDMRHIGYSLYEVTGGIAQQDEYDTARIYFYKNEDNGGFEVGDSVDIGTFTMGRYYDFPVSPDLSVKLGFSSAGINRKTTIGGSDLTEITYLKPNWGNHSPWTHISFPGISNPLESLWKEDYKKVSYKGKRNWRIKFSYIDKSDMFPQNMEKNMTGDYTASPESFDVDTSIISSFLALTLNGTISFLFQPDNTKQDFAICKLDKNSLSIDQVAHGTYSISMTFSEVW